MKILINTGLYPPEIGGPATYAVLVERELIKRGHTVRVLPFRTVRKYPTVIRHVVYFMKTIKHLLWADIVLAQDTVSVGLPSVLASKCMNKRVVVRVPGDFAWEQGVQRFCVKETIDDFQHKTYGFRVEILRRIQGWVVRHADFVITPSDYFLHLVRGWGVKDEKSERIYNGVSIPQNIIPKDFDTTAIVSAGRLVPWKGFDTLIDSLESVEANLYIAGDGSDKERLQKLADEKGVASRVHFLGSLPREELLCYIAGADLFVLPSSFESFSFQLVEAMMLSKAVVALNAGNLAEIIKNGESGILVDRKNVDDFPLVLNRLLTHEHERKRLGKNAKEYSQKFSVEKTVDELVDIFQRIV